MQIALEQAFVQEDYAKNRLGKINPLLSSDSLKIQVNEKLVKLDPHKIEFFLINLFIAVQTVVLQNKPHWVALGINSEDIISKVQHFSEVVLPPFRKRKEYLLSLLAKHEVNSNSIYNKKIFNRVGRGHYQLNAGLQIWCNETWMTIGEIFSNYDLSEKEMKDHQLNKHIKEMNEWTRKYEKNQRENRSAYRSNIPGRK